MTTNQSRCSDHQADDQASARIRVATVPAQMDAVDNPAVARFRLTTAAAPTDPTIA
jgi:hypothetical protein